MIILSHRGYWLDPGEKNQAVAFSRSFECGFGTETDLRDIKGTIVISHDMPKGGELTFEELLKMMDHRNLPLALNIKADGMAESIKMLLKKYGHDNYFTFDMSIPDQIVQLNAGLQVFTGFSDVIKQPILWDQSEGVWLDCFYSDWYEAEVVDALIKQGKRVCIVSADLHRRDTQKQWSIIKKCRTFSSGNLMLCTDVPQHAKSFFYEQD